MLVRIFYKDTSVTLPETRVSADIEVLMQENTCMSLLSVYLVLILVHIKEIFCWSAFEDSAGLPGKLLFTTWMSRLEKVPTHVFLGSFKVRE